MPKPPRVALALLALLLALVTGCAQAQAPIGEIAFPSLDQGCEVASGGALEVRYVRIQNVLTDAQITWVEQSGGTFDDPAAFTTTYRAPATDKDITVTIDAVIQQNGQVYWADPVTCTVRAQGAPQGTVVVQPAQNPADAPAATPAAELVPERLPALGQPSEGRFLYRILVVRPSLGEFGDRGNGMAVATAMVKEDLETGRLGQFAERLRHDYNIELQIDIVEDEANRDIARAIAEEVVRKQDTHCLVGHYNSRSSEAAATVYKQAGFPILMLTPASTHPDITSIAPTVWRLVATDESQARKAYELAAAKAAGKGGKILIVRVARPADNPDTFSDGVVREFREVADPALIHTEPATFEQPASGPADFSATIDAIQNLTSQGQRPGALFYIGTDEQLGQLLSQLDETYKDVPIVGVSLMDNIKTIRELRDMYQYDITYTALAVPTQDPFELVEPWFIQRFEDDPKELPLTAYAAETYDGVYLCARAILRAAELAKAAGAGNQPLSVEQVSAGMQRLVEEKVGFARDDTPAFPGTAAGSYLLNAMKRELNKAILIVYTLGPAPNDPIVELFRCDRDSAGELKPCSLVDTKTVQKDE